MAYVRKLKDKWQAQIERNGKRTSKTFETKREAQQWAMEQEASAKRHKDGRGHTFGDAVDKYKLQVTAGKDGALWEGRRLEAMREFFGNSTLLADLDTPNVADWRDTRLKTVSASTVVREANILRNLFNVARNEWRWMEHRPFEGLKLPQENAPRDAIWPWQLIKRVLRAERIGKTAEMQAAFHIALRTGMRLGEVLAAPQNYDAARRVVTLSDVAGARKTAKVYHIPIGRVADKLLKREPFTVGANEGSTLFSKMCRELLIEGYTFHDTRATALTHLSKKVDVMTLAKISRHKDLSLLMNVYYRPRLEDIAQKI